MKKHVIFWFGALAFLALAWLWLELAVLPYVAIRPQRVQIHLHDNFKAMVPLEEFWRNSESFDIVTEDGLTLDGVLLPATDACATVILVHGIGACKEFFVDFASRLADAKFNVILFDLRAQGQSEGSYCTYGGKETSDIRCLVDAITKRFPGLPIAIYGSSLGGALALQAMGNDARTCCGIVESTYHKLEPIMNTYWTYWTSLHCPNLVHRTMLRSAQIADFNPLCVDPIDACQRIDRPILFAHGSNDEKIPLEFNWKNYQATKSAFKEFVTITEAGHLNLHQMGGEWYNQKMIAFLCQHLTPSLVSVE